MVAARLQCSKRRCDWPRDRPKPAVACASHSGAQRSAELIGSRHHLGSLPEEARRHIALYINLDMVGSPNFARFVQGSTANGDGLAAVVRREFLAEFREHNLSVEERAEGRFGFDVASFSQKGIPTMGLYTGAGRPKSEIKGQLVRRFGWSPLRSLLSSGLRHDREYQPRRFGANIRALVRALNAAAIAASRARGHDLRIWRNRHEPGKVRLFAAAPSEVVVTWCLQADE